LLKDNPGEAKLVSYDVADEMRAVTEARISEGIDVV
jgi:hypothetical protein